MPRFYVLALATLLSAGAFHSFSDYSATATPIRSSKALDREPPEAVYEVSPTERPGYVWAPGCWKWNKERLVWGPGRWLPKRPGYNWVPDGWEQRADKWYFAEGYWESDGSEPAASETTMQSEENAEMLAPVAAPAKAGTVKAKVKKRKAKQPNYSDTKIWIHRRPYQ